MRFAFAFGISFLCIALEATADEPDYQITSDIRFGGLTRQVLDRNAPPALRAVAGPSLYPV